eukprot:16441377-Heterocapsa_arctica.AAC.1
MLANAYQLFSKIKEYSRSLRRQCLNTKSSAPIESARPPRPRTPCRTAPGRQLRVTQTLKLFNK